MEYHEFKVLEDEDFLLARKVVKEVFDFMCTDSITQRIAATHQVNATSHAIQDIFLSKCIELGFSSEKKGLFSEYATSRLRPDYYRPINNSGLIMEVERGKTITNNMDLLDLWKCHICEKADFLLLVVPVIRQTNSGGKTNIFPHVVDRLSTFFSPNNQVNVRGCFIIGY